MLFFLIASPDAQFFIHSVLALAVFWSCFFLLRNSRNLGSNIAFITLAFLAIGIFYFDQLLVVLREGIPSEAEIVIILPISGSILLCAQFFEYRTSRRRFYRTFALAMLLLGVFSFVLPNALLSQILIPVLIFTLITTALSYKSIFDGYLHSHLPRTKRGRTALLRCVISFSLWIFIWTIQHSKYLTGDYVILIDPVNSLLLANVVLTFAYFLIRLNSNIPGRHIRRNAAYSIFVSLGLGLLFLIISTLFAHQLAPSISNTTRILAVIISVLVIVIQPLTIRIREICARFFTPDLEERMRMAFRVANTLMSIEDLHGILTSYLDELRFNVGAEKATLRLNSPPSPEFTSIEVPPPRSIASNLESLEFSLAALDHDSGSSLGNVNLEFDLNDVYALSNREEIKRYLITFTEKLIENLDWYSLQETYWSQRNITELQTKMASALNLKNIVATEKLKSYYVIDGINNEHQFYKDVQKWIRSCQASKVEECNHPPFEGLRALSAENYNQGPRQFIFNRIIEMPPPLGLKPKGNPDPNDPNWQIYAILKLAISECCKDGIICQRIGFESSIREIRDKSKNMQFSQDKTQNHETELFFDQKPKKNSHATYRRRKNEGLRNLVTRISQIENEIRQN